jgi:hypothetical protein
MTSQIIFMSDLVYDGEVVNGKPEGFGKLSFGENRPRYIGSWKNGRYHGAGTLFDFSGKTLFTGEFRNGKYFSGRGKQFFSGGERHAQYKQKWHHYGSVRREGEWVCGEFVGTQYRRPGDRKNALCDSAQLTQIKVAGNKVTGSFSFAGRAGVYDGDWVEGAGAHGRGTLRDFDGAVIYRGDWKYGQFAGYGVLVFRNGDVYMGQLKKGQPWGFGTRTDRNGAIVAEGFWKAGVCAYVE